MRNSRHRFLPPGAESGSVEHRFLLAERPARHLRWSVAISRAFRRAEGLPPWPPGTLTFKLRAKRLLSLVRRVMNVRLSGPRVDQRVAVTNNVLTQRVLFVREGNSHTGRDSRVPTLRLHGRPSALHHSHVLERLSLVERRSEHRIAAHGSAAPGTLARSPSASTTSPGARTNAVTYGVGAPEMTARITRRLRRVEEALPFSSEPRVVAGAAPFRGVDELVGGSARRSSRDASLVQRSELIASAPTTPGVNVTHLTDEVMRQIDRRLVAFRERMGKI